MLLLNLQTVESKCAVRSCIKLPTSLGPAPPIEDWGCLPSLEQLGLSSHNVGFAISTFLDIHPRDSSLLNSTMKN